jgi:transposase-like protein
LRLFSADLTATQIAQISSLNVNTVNRYLQLIRHKIAVECKNQAMLSGIIEADESYFGARRVKGKRGRGAYGKTIVFGLYKLNGNVYTEIVPDCSQATLQAVIRGRVSVDSVINTDGWRGYNGLVDLGYEKHLRVDHHRNEFVKGRAHINDIEGFWGFTKLRLARFRGLHRSTFYLHLKECEGRFNNRSCDLYKLGLQLFRN